MKIDYIIKEEILSFLNEMSLHSMNYNNIITPEYIKSIEMSDNYERFIENYQYEENKVDIDKDEIEESEDFKNWFKYELQYRYDDVIDKLNDVISSNNTIDIWRMMTVDDNWINNLHQKGKHLGIYWSWDENSAEAHWGNSGQRITLNSNVREAYVNWVDTIQLNMDISLGEEEKEIRLFKNTPIKIIEMMDENNHNLLELPEYKQITEKTFYA